jgi:hypothetical protein
VPAHNSKAPTETVNMGNLLWRVEGWARAKSLALRSRFIPPLCSILSLAAVRTLLEVGRDPRRALTSAARALDLLNGGDIGVRRAGRDVRHGLGHEPLENERQGMGARGQVQLQHGTFIGCRVSAHASGAHRAKLNCVAVQSAWHHALLVCMRCTVRAQCSRALCRIWRRCLPSNRPWERSSRRCA